MIKPGIWRHYADKLYLVVGMATHSETNEEMVLYIPLYTPLIVPGKHQIVVRPAKMWNEDVELCGCGHSYDSHLPDPDRPDITKCGKMINADGDTCTCKQWDLQKLVRRFTFERDA